MVIDSLNMTIQEKIVKSIKLLLQENAEIITEKWSFSDKVDNMIDEILNLIRTDFCNSTENIITKNISLYNGIIKDCIIFEEKYTIEYYVYNANSKETIDYVYDNAFNKNGIIEAEKTLILTLYSVNYEWVDEYCERNLAHELEHLLQMHYGLKNNKKYQKLSNSAYELAVNIICNKENYNKFDLIVAKLFYYSNPHEQDAFIQEYGQDLQRNHFVMLLKNAEIHKILKLYEELSQTYIQDKNKFQNALSRYRQFGYTNKNFEVMIAKQFKRLKKKFVNIEKNVNYSSHIR